MLTFFANVTRLQGHFLDASLAITRGKKDINFPDSRLVFQKLSRCVILAEDNSRKMRVDEFPAHNFISSCNEAHY